MSRTLVHDGHVLLELKPLHYVAKTLGLAPFSFKLNSVTNKETIDIKFTSNIGGFIISAVIFFTLLNGFIFSTVQREFSFTIDPGDTLCNAISVPTNIISSLILVIMTSTVNRYKLEELVEKLTVIDEELCHLRGGCAYLKNKIKVQLYIPILALTISFMCYDTFVWSKSFNTMFCIIKRFSHIITLVAVMQFCKMVQIIVGRLSGIHEALSLILPEKLSQVNTPYVHEAEERHVSKKVYSLTSTIMHVASADVLGNSMSLQNMSSDLKAISLTEMQTILSLRRIYNHLYECVKIINFLFGIPILIDMSRTITGVTACLYSVVRLINEPTEAVTRLYFSEFIISRTMWITLLLGTIVSVTVLCEMAASRANSIRHKVQTLLLQNPLRRDVLEQLKMFSQQMSKDRIEFTAAGFFIINLSLLCTFVASVTTYIIVLIQFKSH
jgi:hypothetical protein